MPDSTATKCHMCPAGSFCVGDHLNPASCPAGFYCPNGTGYDWKACPPGTFSNSLGLSLVSGTMLYSFFILFDRIAVKMRACIRVYLRASAYVSACVLVC